MRNCFRLLLCALVIYTPVQVYGQLLPGYSANSIVPRSPATSSCNPNPSPGQQLRSQLVCSVAPSDDAFVDNLLPNQFFGGLGVLIVQNTPSVPVSRNYAFLKFDLAMALPQTLVESNARPTNATLWMYVRLITFAGNATVEIHRALSSDWNETAVTWNNMPAIDPDNYSVQEAWKNGTWVHWDVTKIIDDSLAQSEAVTLAAISSQTAWKNQVWFDSEESAYNQLGTTPTLKLTFDEPQLTIDTPYSKLPLVIDNSSTATDQHGNLNTILPWGIHSLSIPLIMPLGYGTRGYFIGWSDNVTEPTRKIKLGNDVTLQAHYELQYQLLASSQYSVVNGTGWFAAGTQANVSVESMSVPAEGFSAWLGVRHTFDHWTGACSSTTQICTIRLDGPKNVTAVWRTDYVNTLLISVLLVASFTTLLAVRARKRSVRRTKSRAHKRRKR